MLYVHHFEWTGKTNDAFIVCVCIIDTNGYKKEWMTLEQPHCLLLVSSKDVFKRAFTIDLYTIEGLMEQKTQPTV